MTHDRVQGVLRLTPLTPVHIGSGEKYMPIDYAVDQGRFKLKDVRAFFEANRDNPQFALDAVASGLKLDDDFLRYDLPFHGEAPATPRRQAPQRRPQRPGGGGRGQRTGPRIDPRMARLMRQAERRHPTPPQQAPAPREDRTGEVAAFVKDPFDRFFLPGSSVKGALRTALACALAEHLHLGREIQQAVRSRRPPQWAGIDLNQRLFGKVIEDGMKAFVLRDSAPLGPEHFAVTPVRVMNVTRRGFEEKRGMKILLESLMPGETAVELPCYLDTWRLEHDTDLARALGGKTVALLRDPKALAAALRRNGRALARIEADFYHDQQQEAHARFFRELAAKDAACMPLGYGTGWHTKTIGPMLQPQDVKAMRDAFGRGRDGRPNKRMGAPGVDLFPKTRKWARGPKGWQPMGWLRVDLLFED